MEKGPRMGRRSQAAKLTLNPFNASGLPPHGIARTLARLVRALHCAQTTKPVREKRHEVWASSYELQLPRPWKPADELRLDKDA